MNVEVSYDATGEIVDCYCSDVMPENMAEKFFEHSKGLPEGLSQARIEISLNEALEINQKSGIQAVIENGEPAIKEIDRTEYIRNNFKVDINSNVALAPGVVFPTGLSIKKLIKK